MSADVCYAGGGIQPYAIPGADLDPDSVIAAADSLSAGGGAVRDAGADVVGTWRGLGTYYEAPESGQLFTVMDPVETHARDFGDAVQQVATVLRAYAEEIRPIKASLDAVRRDAYAFRDKIATNSEWEYDQGLVDENTALVNRVNAAQIKLWDAERTCANGIRALYCAAPWHAATSADDPLGYGVSQIPDDAPMAWGSSVERKDHCPKSAAVGVKRFVWDGVVVDGLWGTVVGLGALVGIKDWTWSADNFTESWTAMGGLIGYADGEWSWGNAGDSWLALGKGLIAYDTWEDDPGRAAGGALFNLATIVVPAGAAVSGTKAAATAAGTTGRAAALLSKGARIVDFLDPVSLAIKGGKLALPKLGDLLTGMRGATEGLGDALRIPDVPTNLDLPTTSLDDLADGMPPLRDPDAGVPSVHEPVEVPAPASQLVGPDGNPIRDTPGGTGSGGDDLAGPQAPPAGPIHTPGTDAPTGGSSHGGGGSHGGGETGGGGSHGGGGTGGGAGGGDAPGGASGGDSPGEGTAGDGTPADGGPTAGGGAGTPTSGSGTVVLDANGIEHTMVMGDDMLTAQAGWQDTLATELRDRGMSPGEFDALVAQPVHQLSRESLLTLIQIRDAMPPVLADDVLQKLIPPDQVANSIGQATFDSLVEPHLRDSVASAQAANTASTYQASSISGFVTRAADVASWGPDSLFYRLGLNYPNSLFDPADSVFAVRYTASDLVDADGGMVTPSISRDPLTLARDAMYMPATDGSGRSLFDEITSAVDPDVRAQRWTDLARAQGMDVVPVERAVDATNPYRGNGFGGTAMDYAPELEYGGRTSLRAGAEMWQIMPDGTQRAVAIFDGDVWTTVTTP